MEIMLNRSRLQEIHEVIRHLADRRSSSSLPEKLLIRTEPGRLSIVATNGEVDAFYEALAPEVTAPAQFVVPFTALAESGKAGTDLVRLSGDVPTPEDAGKYPTLGTDGPKRFHHADWAVLRQHLRNAGDVVASGPDRYAVNRLCLRQEGVVATDGQQLYAGNSLHLPVRKGQTCLVAPPKVFNSKTLSGFARVDMARDDAGMVFRFGDAWTIRLRKQEGRFPSWQELGPKVEEAKGRLVVPQERLPELLERLRQLLEGAGPGTVVRLAFGPKTLTLLDKDEKEIRSVAMPEAVSIGDLPSIMFDPKFLLSALRMGFLSCHFTAGNKPIVATKGSDIYLWMPCVQESAVPAAPQPSAQNGKETPPMQEIKPKTPKAEAQPKPDAQPADLNAALAELDAIKESFRDQSRRVTAVQQTIRARVADLQKREKAVQQALAGLKQLKELAA